MMRKDKIMRAVRKIEREKELYIDLGDGALVFGCTIWGTYYAFYLIEGLGKVGRGYAFDSAEELAKFVLKEQPDIRRWRYA